MEGLGGSCSYARTVFHHISLLPVSTRGHSILIPPYSRLLKSMQCQVMLTASMSPRLHQSIVDCIIWMRNPRSGRKSLRSDFLKKKKSSTRWLSLYVTVFVQVLDIINVQSQEAKMFGFELSLKLKAQAEPAELKMKGNGACSIFFW